jgi:hypothetical protein
MRHTLAPVGLERLEAIARVGARRGGAQRLG